MDTNEKKRSRPMTVEEGELDPQVVVRENRTTTRHGAIEDKTQDN
ncbi:MAG: hypothetical protein Q4E55_06080 [Bacteroidales bacterium]|nr:hypothetical protein [Bacteroidales bacterium]